MVPTLWDTCNFLFRLHSKIAKSEAWKSYLHKSCPLLLSKLNGPFCVFTKKCLRHPLEHSSRCVFPLLGMAPHFCTWWQLQEIYGRQWLFSYFMTSMPWWEGPYWIPCGSNARPIPFPQLSHEIIDLIFSTSSSSNISGVYNIQMSESWSYPPLNDTAEAANRVRQALAERGWRLRP